MVFLLLLLTESSAVPLEQVVRVDVIELNQVRTANGQGDLDQVIFWRWTKYRTRDGWDGRYDVVAWRLAQKCSSKPRYDHKRRVWSLRWCENGKWLVVESGSYRRTRTSFDVELDQRKVLAETDRVGLW